MPIRNCDIYNIKAEIRQDGLKGNILIQTLMQELSESDIYNSIYLLRPTHKIIGLFFCYKESQELLKRNPEMLIMDCTYKTNRFNIPLFNIVGIDCLQ